MDYLILPARLRNGFFQRADLRESITASVGLILSTRIGTIPFDPEFGCILWEREYSDLYTASKADMRASLRNAIDKFEKRLYNVSVSFAFGTADVRHSLGMTVKVTGNFRDNDEEMTFEASYNLG
jgi:phage baseplate assembly protein W